MTQLRFTSLCCFFKFITVSDFVSVNVFILYSSFFILNFLLFQFFYYYHNIEISAAMARIAVTAPRLNTLISTSKVSKNTSMGYQILGLILGTYIHTYVRMYALIDIILYFQAVKKLFLLPPLHSTITSLFVPLHEIIQVTVFAIITNMVKV